MSEEKNIHLHSMEKPQHKAEGNVLGKKWPKSLSFPIMFCFFQCLVLFVC